MTDEELEKLAADSYAELNYDIVHDSHGWREWMLARLKLVRDRTRDECAMVCDERAGLAGMALDKYGGEVPLVRLRECERCASAIRGWKAGG